MEADRDELLARAASFGAVADAYERARPGYPDDAVRWLAGDEPCDVVDLGAGTGKLTRRKAGQSHNLGPKSPKLKRAFSKELPVAAANTKVVKRLLGKA